MQTIAGVISTSLTIQLMQIFKKYTHLQTMLNQYSRTCQSNNLSYLKISHQGKNVLLCESYKFPSSIVVGGAHQKHICRYFTIYFNCWYQSSTIIKLKHFLTVIHPWILKAISTKLLMPKNFNPNLHTKLMISNQLTKHTEK